VNFGASFLARSSTSPGITFRTETTHLPAAVSIDVTDLFDFNIRTAVDRMLVTVSNLLCSPRFRARAE